jgi:hypothetical protein|tara:strand:- start:36 stop:1301 length:1266 start_codon:yes stop_codon:yes gene_type:complete
MTKIHTNIPSKVDNEVIFSLYNLFVEADEYVANKARNDCFKYTHTNINMVSQIPRPDMFSSRFFPKHIIEYIDETALHKIQYVCKIKDRTINIYFVLNDDMYETLKTSNIHFLDNYIRMMYMWIYVLSAFSKETCSKTLSVYVYFTPFKKELPDNQLTTLDAEHVNTAYTTHCRLNNEIVLYREEEWFKVFVHETFHSFGLDFANMPNTGTVNKQLKQLFNVKTDFLLFESYCEFWARTINCIMYTYLQLENKSNTNYNKFEKTFKKNMDRECLHSMYQGLKILNFMGLDYKTVNKQPNKPNDKNADAITTCNYLYKENTAVFSYYIITSLLMNNYNDFMNWCLHNNHNDNNFLEFKKTPGNVDAYIEFIDLSRRDKDVLKMVTKLEKSFLKTDHSGHSCDGIVDRSLRMTTLDMNNAIGL